MPYVIANGISLHYHENGAGDPILWIQGLGADHSAWLGQINLFRHHYRCITFDNRDVGLSAHVEQPYTTREMAGDAAGLLDALSIRSAHVVGLSLGGAIAQELALAFPSRVRSITLVSTMACHDARGRTLIGSWPEIYHKAGPVAFYRQGIAWMFSHRFFERPRSVSAMLRYVQAHPQPADAFARQIAAGQQFDSRSRLTEIKAPTLVVAGEEDILVPPRLSRPLAEVITGARYALLREAGHSVNVERVAAFNQIVLEFLLSIDRPGQ